MTKPITFKKYKEHYKNKTIHVIVDKLKKEGVLFYLDDLEYFYDEIKKDIMQKVIEFIKEEMEK